MATHSAGTKIKLSVVRNEEELEPIVDDSNLNSNYLETRLLMSSRKLLPGDQMMVECTYNTFKRERFTLGGDSTNEEVCRATVLYYPRQEQLVACISQSRIADVLKALGVEELGFVKQFIFIVKLNK
jgi:Copper type II ascorbate-dependent monooxygenase, C-terminal domain